MIGGGFGGLSAARALGRGRWRVTLLDRNNYHLFQPLLYQVATAGLAPSDIAYPIRSILRRQRNTSVVMAEVQAIDAAHRRVLLHDRQIDYDYLVVATGATHSYFGHPEWATRAPGLKDLNDALGIRHQVLQAFERAEVETDLARQRALLTFVIIGAGPTGVELAGALGELACTVMVRDFRNIDPQAAHIILAEAGPRVLPSFPAELSAKADASLRKLCVDVRTGSPALALDRHSVRLGEDVVETETVIWAAGVAASPLGQTVGAPLEKTGRVLVAEDLSVPAHPEVFVIGDLAAYVHQTGQTLPGLAPVALQQGRHVARNIMRRDDGLPTEPFRYRSRGSLATIGRGAAVADFGRLRLSGQVAWDAWALIHILQLIGFRNRMLVFIEWSWAYLTRQRSARLISRHEPGVDRSADPPGRHRPVARPENTFMSRKAT
ncbi:MAG: NAD(P)/FAD-dependent oxidoreductase [bacterium]|nr:NAD(P)/FAD-dependent oxidoreductase [bacterium]